MKSTMEEMQDHMLTDQAMPTLHNKSKNWNLLSTVPKANF
jgi:hypothetical protein